jgi:hypothetical protein
MCPIRTPTLTHFPRLTTYHWNRRSPNHVLNHLTRACNNMLPCLEPTICGIGYRMGLLFNGLIVQRPWMTSTPVTRTTRNSQAPGMLRWSKSTVPCLPDAPRADSQTFQRFVFNILLQLSYTYIRLVAMQRLGRIHVFKV